MIGTGIEQVKPKSRVGLLTKRQLITIPERKIDMEDMGRALRDYENLFHDIKASMSIMYEYIRNLENSFESGHPSIKYVSSVKKSWVSMLKLMDHANNQSQMRGGNFAPSFRNHDIVAILKEITWINASLAKKKKIELLFTSNVQTKIMATDKIVLERIVQNLLSNSIKFTDSFGKIEIILRDMTSKIVLIVRDTGIGIPDGMVEKAFERYQCDRGKRNQFGHGIGLSIVEEFIKLLEGKIRVSSGCKGTEVRIELPAFVIKEPPKEEGYPILLDSFNWDNDMAMPWK